MLEFHWLVENRLHGQGKIPSHIKKHTVTDQPNIITYDERHIMERMDVMLNKHYVTNCFSVFSYTAVNVMASR